MHVFIGQTVIHPLVLEPSVRGGPRSKVQLIWKEAARRIGVRRAVGGQVGCSVYRASSRSTLKFVVPFMSLPEWLQSALAADQPVDLQDCDVIRSAGEPIIVAFHSRARAQPKQKA